MQNFSTNNLNVKAKCFIGWCWWRKSKTKNWYKKTFENVFTLKSEAITDKMFSIHTDDECFHVGIELGNDNSKKSQKSYIAPYQCCPSSKETPQARLSVLSDTKLGDSKSTGNYQTFAFPKVAEKKSAGKPKGSKAKSPPKPEGKAKKEDRDMKEKPAAEKKKRDRDVKEKEPKDSKDKDNDKKDKKGKEKKEKGKNTHGDDGDGFFQLGNWW